ncbi:hypothetical protein SAMN05443287_101541 [Micromonospora phaseoli]|uniref:Uncharacterized protein n=1 Tax=Micromonospora phaseoli TaxID=1144548 RepID=A0A1H6SF01_9ACTN|nr:hypothetical protein CLV64_101541 [Micromonospora phaseoli]SEI62590.1 hypothetical protein SAMN05443287_101541 [Micromonospora phaseoli]
MTSSCGLSASRSDPVSYEVIQPGDARPGRIRPARLLYFAAVLPAVAWSSRRSAGVVRRLVPTACPRRPGRGKRRGTGPATPARRRTPRVAPACAWGRARAGRSRRSSRSAAPDREWSPHTAQKPGHARAGLPAGRPIHLPARVRRQPRPPHPAASAHAIEPSNVHRKDRPLRPAGHCSPSWGQCPRLIGIRCRARHGRSAPHRQTRRHSCHDHTGRCRLANVNAVADRYSSYETRLSRDIDVSLPAAGCCCTPRAWSKSRRRAASCSIVWMRWPNPDAAGGDGKYRLTIRRRSPIATAICPALPPEDTEGHLLMCLDPRPSAEAKPHAERVVDPEGDCPLTRCAVRCWSTSRGVFDAQFTQCRGLRCPRLLHLRQQLRSPPPVRRHHPPGRHRLHSQGYRLIRLAGSDQGKTKVETSRRRPAGPRSPITVRIQLGQHRPRYLLGTGVTRPRQRRGRVRGGLSRVVAIVVLGPLGNRQIRRQPLNPVQRASGRTDVPDPRPGTGLLSCRLDAGRAALRGNPLSLIGKIECRPVVTLSQHVPGPGFETPCLDLAMLRMLGKITSSSQVSSRSSPLPQVDVDGRPQHRQPASSNQQPPSLSKRDPSIQQPAHIGEVPPHQR